jgi:Flp pilus assembly protein TadD
VRDLAFEHRMYLPLSAVVVFVVISGYWVMEWLVAAGWLRRERRPAWAVGLVASCALLLGVATHLRNEIYGSAVSLWTDTVSQAPHNGRAHIHLGNALRNDRPDLALKHYRLAVEINPASSEAHNNLGAMLARSHPEAAIPHCRAALELTPDNADAHNNLANALARRGCFDEAIRHYQETLRLEPRHASARENMKIVAVMQRDDGAAQKAEQLEPDGATHRGT